MSSNFPHFRKRFETDGYFVIKNFVNKNFILQIIDEIEKSQNSIKYFDNQNNLRRIEKLYDKGTNLINLNEMC